MTIGGLQRCSLVDYPGHVAAVIFVQGCNFRCPFCQNSHLVLPERFEPPLDMEAISCFLISRTHLLQGVVVSGGEPLLHDDIPSLLARIRGLGYSVKLDTNGSLPCRLKAIVDDRLVDFIAMDIKAPLHRYDALAGTTVNTDLIKESIGIIQHSGIQYMFRTTFAKPLLDDDDIRQIRDLLGDDINYRVQPINPSAVWLDPSKSAMCRKN